MQCKISSQDMIAELWQFAVAASHGRWLPYPHVVFLAQLIQESFEKDNARVILSVPPRHGKTEIAVVYGSAWYLKKNPYKRFGYVAHTQTLADKKSKLARDVFGSIKWGAQLSQDTNSKQEWNTAIKGADGGFMAAGIDGGWTGLGVDNMVIDDPIKNQAEAFSQVYRDRTFDFWRFTLRDRLQPGASVVLIMHRWHEDDLAGRLLKSGGWTEINIPAIAEENDPLNRAPGEALCPWMYDRKALLEIQREMGSHAFDAKYQGHPSLEGGNLFKSEHFRYFDETETHYVLDDGSRVPKHTCTIYQTIDPAGTTGKLSDFFVCCTFAVGPSQNIFILDVFKEKAETTRHGAIISALRKKWNPAAQYVENKTFGINIIQAAKKDGNPVRALKADTSKIIRAEVAVTMYENGMIYHNRNSPWLADFETELCQFPNGSHDDQVDALSYAAIVAGEKNFNWNKYDEL